MLKSFNTYKQYREVVNEVVQTYLNGKSSLECFKQEADAIKSAHLELLKTDDHYLKSAFVREIHRNHFWLNHHMEKTLDPLGLSVSEFQHDERLQKFFWLAFEEVIEETH